MTFISNTGVPSGPNPPNSTIANVPCDASVYVGAWVRMQGGIAVNALADSLGNSNVIGVVEYKFSDTQATIRFLGVTVDLFSGLDETKEYYLSDTIPGGMTDQTSVPTASGHVVLKLGQPFSSTKFLVVKGNRMQRS